MKPWSLRHAWTLPSDLAALDLCARALAEVGVLFEPRTGNQPHHAIKMHGLELFDMVRSEPLRLHDLSHVSVSARWDVRLPSFIRQYMRDGAQWFGIPMGIHQANLVWVNNNIEQQFGPLPAGDPHEFMAWMRRLQRQLPYPLVLGGEPWQVGLVFESMVVAIGGDELHRQAFDLLLPEAWLDSRMVQSLVLMACLREFVDPSANRLPWTAQLQRLENGLGAVQFMGDWVRAQQLPEVRPMAAPGSEDYFVAINDFFVPLASEDSALQDTVGEILTAPAFQARYAQQKGCMPGVVDAWRDVDTARAALLMRPAVVLHSFVFDQCGALDMKNALLTMLADWFSGTGQAAEQAQRMAQLCGLFRTSKGLP